MLPLFETTYSTKQLYDLIEICDVHDTVKKMAHDKLKVESQQKK